MKPIKEQIKSNYFLGVRVDQIDSNEALNKVQQLVNTRSEVLNPIYFVNVHSIFLALQNHKLMEQLNNASLTLADGSGLDWAGKILDQPILENLNGTDFTPKVLEMAQKENWSVYFLGAGEEVIEKAQQRIRNDFPELEIAGYHHGYFRAEEERLIIDDINKCKPDILLVGMGSPVQENWIWERREELNVSAAFAIGGLFDFLAGEFPRAPLWMRKIGLEWVYRFWNDPGSKWKRVLIEIPLFLPIIIMAELIPKKVN